jgi:hypothetical protein
MSSVRRRGLQIDDPLGSAEPTQPDKGLAEAGRTTTSSEMARRPVETTDHPSEEGQRGEREGEQAETGTPRRPDAPASQAPSREVWRAWSGITGVGSFRLPHELLVELGDTARELGLPIGMIVTAAIAQLLDQPPERIAELVDRADDARIQGHRNARRRLGERTGS